jgi:hypothetical protein
LLEVGVVVFHRIRKHGGAEPGEAWVERRGVGRREGNSDSGGASGRNWGKSAKNNQPY